MQDQYHRLALPGQLPGQAPHLQLVGHVQKCGGLVQKEGGCVLGQGHGQIDPLALTAGQLRHGPPGQTGRIRLLQSRHGGGIVLLSEAPGIGQMGKASVEHHAQGGDIGHRPGLGQIGGFLGPLTGGERRGIRPVDQHLPPGQGQQTQSCPDQSAFAAAVRTQQSQHLPGAQSQVDAIQDHMFAIARPQLPELHHGVRPPLCFSSSHKKKGPPPRDKTMPTGSS